MQNKFLKKTISIACTAGIIMSAFAGMAFSASAAEKIQMGDITSDGVIDILDVVSARSHIVGNKLLEDSAKTLGDVNYDGILNISDVVKIRYAVVTPEYTYEEWGNGSVIITSYNRFEKEIEIPETIDGFKVEDVFLEAFYNSPWFEAQPDGVICLNDVCLGYKGEMPENAEITIPDGTKRISLGAFMDEENIKKVNLPDSLVDMGDMTFAACVNLETINIPSSITEIKTATFMECSSLKNIVIPNSVTKIGIAAFGYCESLDTFTIPSSVTEIGLSAFDRTAWYYNQTDAILYKDGWLLTFKDTSEPFYDMASFQVKDGTKGIVTGLIQVIRSVDVVVPVTIPASVIYINDIDFENGNIVEMLLGMLLEDLDYNPDFVLYGTAGSAAETYAKERGIKFSAIA